MQHLESTRLAAFDHDPFTAEELAHLAACAACRTERDAMMVVVAQARRLGAATATSDAPRLVGWEQIAAGLRAADAASAGIRPQSPSPGEIAAPREQLVSSQPWFRQVRRAAAAAALVAGGAAMGRLSSPLAPLPIASATTAQPAAMADAGFASVEQATEVLDRAQRDYERASVWLAANDPAARSSDVYRARLAALDQMMAASRAALRDAPQDPVLNHYYLSAWSAREATLQALSGALPVDKVIERY